jgi:hypothetical protein
MDNNNSFQQRYTKFKADAEASNSPLAELYRNEYDFNNRYYPRNLGSEARGHYINFYINVASGSMYNEKSRYKIIDGFRGRTATNQANGNTITAVNLKDNINEIAGSEVVSGDITLGRRTKRISEAIALYMPETMNVQYGADWQSQSLTEAGGKTLMFGSVAKGLYDDVKGGFGQTIKNIATDPGLYGALAEKIGDVSEASGRLGSGATDFLLQATGQALNPQLEVLFKGTDMREFQFDFLFVPHDAQESLNVLEIIKTFKFHMAPEVNSGLMGRYFTPPSEFDIDFLFNGQINNKVHQVGTCVLKNLNVDYAPNGWATFGDGSPTQIRMTLQFMETEIVTKQRIDEGY